MKHFADDDLEESSDEGNPCPFCGSEDGCCHLLAHIDVTFGQVEGGTFFDLNDQAVKVMGKAIMDLLQVLEGRPDKEVYQVIQDIKPARLATLVEEVRQEIGDSLDENDLDTCYGRFLDYLCEMLDELPGVVETTWDFEDGPGQSSEYKSYWVKYAKRVAKRVLGTIEQEASSLHESAQGFDAST
jgi:hypothetical protein